MLTNFVLGTIVIVANRLSVELNSPAKTSWRLYRPGPANIRLEADDFTLTPRYRHHMKVALPARAWAATALAATGLAYIGYLFVLACEVMANGIPDDVDYYLGRVSPEADTLAFSSSWALLPLVLVLVLILVLARTSRAPDESRLAYVFLVAGVPLATVAYFVWYRLGW